MLSHGNSYCINRGITFLLNVKQNSSHSSLKLSLSLYFLFLSSFLPHSFSQNIPKTPLPQNKTATHAKWSSILKLSLCQQAIRIQNKLYIRGTRSNTALANHKVFCITLCFDRRESLEYLRYSSFTLWSGALKTRRFVEFFVIRLICFLLCKLVENRMCEIIYWLYLS